MPAENLTLQCICEQRGRLAGWLTAITAPKRRLLVLAHTYRDRWRRRSLATKSLRNFTFYVVIRNQISGWMRTRPPMEYSLPFFSLVWVWLTKDICQGRKNPWGYLLQLASHIVSPSPTLWGKEPCPRGVSLPCQRSYAAWGKTVILPGPPFSHLSSKRAHFPCLPPTILGEIMEGRNKWNLARKINLSVYRHLYIFSSSLFFLQVCFSVLASPF